MSQVENENWHEINKIFNRLDEIRDELEKSFPSYEFIYRIKYFKEQLGLVYTELEEYFKARHSAPSKDELKAVYPKVQRNILFYFLLTEMIFQHFKNDQEIRKHLLMDDKVKTTLNEYQSKGPLVIAKAFRNVLAHIRPFDDEALMFQAGVFKGEPRVTFRFDIAISDWEKLRRFLRNKVDEPGCSNAFNALTAASYQIYNPEKKCNETRYALMPILKLGMDTLFSMFSQLESLYSDHHSEDIKRREDLHQEDLALEERLRGFDIGPIVTS